MMDEKRLIELARELIGCEELDLETERENVEGWDSLTHVMLIAAVAETFNVSIAIDEASKIKCLGDFLKYA